MVTMLIPEEKTYLGFDFSTQQLKGLIVNDELNVLMEENVQFDRDLPEFRTHKGVVHAKDGKTITAPTVMWVKAIDMLLDKLQVAGADFSKLAAVSGSAQQHGTVYWQRNSQNILGSLDPSSFLHTQLASCFTIANSPVWMDASTTKYCANLEHTITVEELLRITGSVAYERFSGPQIAKIADTKKIAYENTERISLISSFACSIFLGKYAPIDFSDGSGMNLLDIETKRWHPNCLQACAPNLADKLGQAAPSDDDLGVVNHYFVERFAFNPNCRVISFTGDNPASLIGMALHSGDIAVSLGTSDTLFLWLEEKQIFREGHVFVNPLQSDAYMGLLCFKNGSIIRERFRDDLAEKSWQHFNELLEKTPRGNFGNFGLFYDVEEIIPRIRGEFRFDKQNNPLSKFPSREVEIRALIEGQLVAKRAYAEDLGFIADSHSRILATGGASKNKAILQVLSDVFNVPVFGFDGANSAVLGAAYLAKQGLRDRNNEKDPVKYFRKITEKIPEPSLICKPYTDADQVYTPMVRRFRTLIKEICGEK